MIRIWATAVAAAMMMFGAGAAQAAMTPAETVALCAKAGAFGQTFGGGPAKGAQFMINSVFAEVTGYDPFTQAELVYTPNSRKLHTVNVSARYASDEAARKALAALGVAAKASGRFKLDEDAEGGEDDITFNSADGMRLNLFLLGPELNLACVDTGLQQRAMDELMGVVPVTEKPEPPRLALAAPPPADVCATPESRAAFLAGFEDRMKDAMSFGSESSRYSTMLGQWKAGQLKAKRVWTEDDESAFAMAMLGDPAFNTLFEASMNDFTGFMADLAAYSEADDRKDQVGACNAALRALGSLRQMLGHSQAQWAFIAARYDAEAKRKGVVLD